MVQSKAGDIVSQCRFFMRVQGPAMDRLRSMARLRTFQKGEMIFRQGDRCPGVYVVGSGLVRIYKMAPSGKEHVLHMVAPGGTFAEVAAIGRFDCPAFAEAIEDTSCALLPMEEFNRALADDHQLCLQLMMSLSMWVRHLIGLVEDITLRDAIGRVSRYLLTIADARDRAQLPSLKKHLASHLNLTSETLSRTLRRLDEMGVVDTGSEDLQILDREALTQIAETGSTEM